ncbi:putative disease resistance RPP13-like protein 1 [Quercus robur]|uniref:putative disease resistance RPP13-like protein 1 n=1 Tax=Quercus robur TaxID=38942 RepID=UPI002161E69A|nr:putative disease resistance RPP13-like protein 1 [Quercus robur]
MAAALVGGAALGAAMEVLLERLTSKEFSLIYRDFNNELKRLKRVLLSVNAVVDDAEEKQYHSPRVKAWLDDFKDAFYHLEDLIDDIFTQDMKTMLDVEYSQIKVRTLGYVFGMGMGIKIKMEQILARMELAAKQKDVLGLRETILGYDTKRPPIKPTTSLVHECEVFGRDCDKEEILNHLLSKSDHGQPSVITVVGMGGIGKTTLAQLVYNDHRVGAHFDVRAWACVSDNFDMFRVTKTIFESLTSKHFDFNELNLLQLRLQEKLRQKRFLLVLDDVWNDQYNDWEVLLSPFKVACMGSCIIVTTRSQRVAEMVNDVNAHHLKELSTSESWSLFARIAFGNQRPSSDLELEAIGKEIVEKCRGLPLAVKSFAASLRSKLQVKEWITALECLTVPTEMRDVTTEMRGVLSALKRSYDHLPAHLKLCFAYCSVFPKGYEIEKEKLVLLWMAEGLLQQHRGNRRMEEVGDKYFNELLAMSFYQPSSGNKSRFKMHDLINDLAIYLCGRFCFRLGIDDPSRITAFIRYMSLFRCKNDSPELYEVINEAKYLRTFLSLDNESYHLTSDELHNLFSKLQYLRVLCLSHYHIVDLPDSIGSLNYIRYIDLSHTAISKLPESVCFLCNLQTLILSFCHSLTELPKNMWKLIKLRHLDISGTALYEMPEEMSRLKNLQTLPYFVVGERSGSTVKELGGLLYLRGTLYISKLQNVVSTKDAAEASLAKKTYLDDLTLEWDENTVDSENDRDVLAQLVPHTNLKRLSIIFYGASAFPYWLGDISFSKMQFLCLSNCKKCFYLPPLGRLPSLKDLIIGGMNAVERVGPEFYGKKKPFQSLETLTFEEMLEWEEWVPFEAEEWDPFGEFPCLQELCIRRCPKLKGQLPKQLPNIEKVEISESQELKTALTMEELSQKMLLHYHDKVLFISEERVSSFSKQKTDFKYDRALESSLHPTEGAAKSLLHRYDRVLSTTEDEVASFSKQETDFKYDGATESSLLLTEGAAKGLLHSSDRVLSIEDEVASFSEDMTVTSTVLSYDFPSTSSENVIKNSNTRYEGALKSPLPMTQTTNIRRDEADVPNDTWDSQDGLQNFSSSVSKKVSEISQLKNLSPYLQSLKIEGCDAQFISEALGINRLVSLQHMYIINCCSLKSFPGGRPPTSMKSLYIQNCKKLELLPPAERTHQYAVLEHLCIGSSCDSLTSFPLGFFPKLRSLSIWDCANLVSLSMPEGIQKDLRVLESLEIRDCPKLVSFPEGLPTPNLKSIWFSNCMNLKELPDQLHTLNSLQSMFINNCPELVLLPEKGLPSKLILLSITSCNKLMLGMKWGLDRLHHLSRLEIEGGCGNVVSFPEKLLPSNLNSLRISGLLNLKFLDKGLQHLTTLKTLEISCCNRLRSLPEEGLPSSLSFLCIKECSVLKPKLQNKAGKDWSKIAHISRIEID